MPTDDIATVHIGLGPIGLAVARLAHERPGVGVTGAVDVAPDLIGRRLGELLGLDGEPGDVAVVGALDDAVTRRAHVALHCAGSSLPQVARTLSACMAAGLDVVSTCEELAYPWDDHPDLAERLDREARAAGVTLLGTGVNPGFVMDFLPAVLTGPCQRVSAIEVVRIQDAGTRRLSLQRKVGAGLRPGEFAAGVEAGRLGHVGLGQSVRALAAALGWRLDDVAETVVPLIAEGTRDCEAGTIEPGMVAGVHQVAVGSVAGHQRIRLTLEMGVGIDEPRDEVFVHGDPELRARFPGGISGDRATAALVINVLPHVVAAAPGLVSMADLPPPRPWGEPSSTG